LYRFLLLLPFLVAGCATVDCGSDWFAIGQRDGRINAGSQAERYAVKCHRNRHGALWRGLPRGIRPAPDAVLVDRL